MKILLQLVLILSILFAATDTYPQQQTLSTGLAPFNKAKSHVTYGKFPLADIAYANDNSTSQNISMPIPAGNPFTVIGTFTAPVFAASMCEGGDGNYYLLDAAPALYLFDPGSGTCTLIGNITGMNGDQPNGISYNIINNKYYMVSSSALYTLDINSLNATLVGSFSPSLTGLMIDLCFDYMGTCYAYEVNITPGAANGYIIDITDAHLTTLGYLGYTPNYGQGMSYDYETNTIYLSAFNLDTFSGQLRIMDETTGMTTLVYDWVDQIAPFVLNTDCCGPCPVGEAGNPDPPDDAIDIPVSGTILTWDNDVEATGIEVYFGPSGNMEKIYDGSPITSWETGFLQYFTTYSWRIVGKNDTCGTSGPTWSFTTIQNPFALIIHPANAQYWTGSTDGSTKTDGEINTVYPKVGWAVYYLGNIPPFYPIDDLQFNGYVNIANWPYWSATPMGSINPVNDLAGNINSQILANYDQNVAYIYQDESSSFTYGWHTYAMSNSALSDLQQAINSGQGWFAMGFVDCDFSAAYFINFDGWSQTNPPFLELENNCMSCSPNPPSNLTAVEIVNGYPKVLLNWQDNSDESGFRIYRKNGYPNALQQFEQIGGVSANITEYIDTTVIFDSTYSYGVTANNYLYSSFYSNFVTITIDPIPVELTSFRADINDGSVVLNWSTATETNNQGFEMQKSEVGDQRSERQWVKIGFVEGNGTTTEPESYSYTDKNLNVGKYNYRLKQIDFDGSFKYSNVVEVDVNTPMQYSLSQNYPNPFNPTTQINYSVPSSQKVVLKVYDILGNEVATLVNQNQNAGNYSVGFSAKDRSASGGNTANLPRGVSAKGGYASGVYFYQIRVGEFVQTKKMILLK